MVVDHKILVRLHDLQIDINSMKARLEKLENKK